MRAQAVTLKLSWMARECMVPWLMLLDAIFCLLPKNGGNLFDVWICLMFIQKRVSEVLFLLHLNKKYLQMIFLKRGRAIFFGFFFRESFFFTGSFLFCFVAFLLLCFSAFLFLLLFCFPAFLLFGFPVFLLVCFSVFFFRFSASLLFHFFGFLLACFSASLLLLCFLVFLLSCSCFFVMPCCFVVSSVLAALARVLCEW